MAQISVPKKPITKTNIGSNVNKLKTGYSYTDVYKNKYKTKKDNNGIPTLYINDVSYMPSVTTKIDFINNVYNILTNWLEWNRIKKTVKFKGGSIFKTIKK